MVLSHKHLRIQGKVQGVGFRQNAFILATKLGLKGWVKNTREGDVEIVVQGEDSSVLLFAEWCHEGPIHSVVRSVVVLESREIADCEFTYFTIENTS